jgi:hypothetical protein
MVPSAIFGGGRRTRTVRCNQGRASVNPEYDLQNFRKIRKEDFEGVPAQKFASWYSDYRNRVSEARGGKRRDPWLVRGLSLAISPPQS